MQRGDVLVPFAVIRQEPVGHGGFHTGAFCFPDLHHPCLHWVYDCGSWHKARTALQKRIKGLVKRVHRTKRPLDLLFVSHFDVDHVNGLHTLLDQLPVDTVVIPYLEPADAFVVVAAAVERQNATPATDPDWRKWLLELHQIVFDPQSWFGRRGVRRVIVSVPDRRLSRDRRSARDLCPCQNFQGPEKARHRKRGLSILFSFDLMAPYYHHDRRRKRTNARS